MASPHRVLYVDDEPGLLTIAKIFLERDGAFSVHTLTSAAVALEQLNTERYDAIISDYQMPGMDGIAFLKQLKASGNTTPFIIFTGKGREDVVIEALNEGADFYLQKGGEPKAQFAELAHKIQSAINSQRTEKLAKDTERRLYDIINFLPDATFAIDSGGHVIAWNRAIEEMTGVPSGDMLGKGNYEYSLPFYGERRPILIDLVSLPDDELSGGRYSIIKKEGDILIAETTLPRPLGRYSVLLGKASVLHNEEGVVIGAIESIRDITEQKRSETELRESEQKYRDIFENSVTGLFKTAPDGHMINANDALARMYGYPCATKILKTNVNAGQFYADREDRKKMLRILREKGVVENYETLHLKRDGTRFWVAITARTVRDTDGSVLFFEGSTIDITGRKRAEEALHESEFFNRGLVENLPDYIAVYGKDGKVLYVNPASEKAIGYSAAELVGTHVLSYVAPEYHEAVIAKITARHKGENLPAYEIDIITKDGSRRSVIAKGTPIHYHDSQATLLLLTDITERKAAEAALQRHSTTLSILNGIISTANKADDLPRLLNSILEESLRLLDFDAGGIYLVNRSTRTADVVRSKNLPPELLAEIQTIPIDKKPYDTLFILNEPIFTENYPKIAPERSKRWGLQSMASIPLLSKGVAIGALNIVSSQRYVISETEKQTLTSIGWELGSTLERMIADEEIKKASENLETLFNSIDEMVFVLDMQGVIITVNDAALKRLGYRPEELAGMNVLQLHVPERRNEVLQIVLGMIAGTINSCPVPVCARDGQRIEVETKVTRGWWHNQEVLIGVSRDVTERKRAEAALMESELLFREVFNNANDAVFLLERTPDGPGNYILVNEKAVRMLGYSQEELLEMSPRDIVPQDIQKKIIPDVMEKLRKHGHATFESAHRRKDGSVYPIEVSTHTFRYRGKDVDLSIIRDITGRKKAEVALLSANRKLNLLSGVTRHDIKNQLMVQKGYLELIGETPLDPSQEEYFRNVSIAGQRICAMVEFTKEYEEIGIHAPVWHDWRILIDTAAKELSPGIVVVINGLPAGTEVFADPLITKVCYNLMDNAVRYGGKITTIRFSVTGCNRDTITCEDDGFGIPDEEKEKIFERGFGKNTGIGLFLAREILSITGITIKETGEPGKGARFEIIMPKGTYRLNTNTEISRGISP